MTARTTRPIDRDKVRETLRTIGEEAERMKDSGARRRWSSWTCTWVSDLTTDAFYAADAACFCERALARIDAGESEESPLRELLEELRELCSEHFL